MIRFTETESNDCQELEEGERGEHRSFRLENERNAKDSYTTM